MLARRIERTGVAQPELRVERRTDWTRIAELVSPDDAAQAVRRLDVEVDRQQRPCSQLRQLGSVTSEATFTVVAPSCSSTRSAAGFDGAIITEIFQTHSAGSSPAACMSEHREQPDVRDQEAADACLDRARDVLHGIRQLARSAQLAEVRRAVRRARVRADVEALARPDEERDLEPRVGAKAGHVAQLDLLQEHRAAALRDAVDHDVVLAGGVEHCLEHARVLDARDLDAEVRPVREPPLAGTPLPDGLASRNRSSALIGFQRPASKAPEGRGSTIIVDLVIR